MSVCFELISIHENMVHSCTMFLHLWGAWCSNHKPSRRADPKNPNNGYPFFFHLCAAFAFFYTYFFHSTLLPPPPPHALSLSFYLSFSLLSIWSSPRYFLERPHFNDAMYSTCCRLRALSSIIFADLNMNNAAAAAERAVLYKIMQFFSASQPFLFFFSVFFFLSLVFSVSVLFDPLNGPHAMLSLCVH